MKILKNIFLIILILVLFISSCSLIILAPIKYAVNPDSINKVITNIDIETLVEENPEFHETINKTLEPVLNETKKLGVDEKTIMKIVNSKEIKGMMAGVTSNLIDYTLTGKEHELISIDQIKDLVNNAIDDINKSGYYEISNEDKENILNVVTKESSTIEEVIPDTNIIEENLPSSTVDMLGSIRFIFGNKLIICLAIGVVISLIGIVILKWKEAKWLKCSSITIMVSSLIVLIGVMAIRLGSKMLLKDNTYILTIIKSASKYNLALSLIVFVIMLITIIVYSILHKKKVNAK